MAETQKTFPAESGLILYCFPDQRYGVSLADWDDDAAEATEQAAPNLGRYDVTLDDTYRYWMVFEGGDQPTDWDQWVIQLDIVEESVSGGSWTEEEKAQIRYRLGLDGATQAPSSPSTVPIVIPQPEEAHLSTGATIIRTGQGAISPNTLVTFQLVGGTGALQSILRTDRFTIQSDEAGLLVGTFIRGAQYRCWRKTETRQTVFRVPNESTFLIPEIVD